MSTIRWFLVAVLACGALAACDTVFGKELNPKYCAAHPDDVDCRGDASQSCSSTAQCTAPLVCDVGGTTMCVECTQQERAACTGTMPVCDDDRTCRACRAHSECLDSDACLPDGSCGDDTMVAYVDPAGSDNANCTKATPCTLVSKALATNRPYVKLTGTTDEAVTVDNGRVVTFLADPEAVLTRTNGTGAIVTVRDDGTSLSVYDLSISDAPNSPSGIGIVVPAAVGAPTVTLTRTMVTNNPGGGVSASGGTLTVSQSTISGNTGGGVSLSGAGATFNITNSFIVRNGDELAGTFGGLSLGIAAAGNNRLEFNTIVDNKAAVNSAGVVCNVPAFMAPNNIVARNNLAGSTTTPGAQTTMGGCTYPSSRVQNDVAGLMFEHPDPPGTLSYELLLGSTAIDQATTPSDIAVDHEGEPRPSGAGKDIGADELQQ